MTTRYRLLTRMLTGMALFAAVAATALAAPKLEVVGGETIDWGKVGPARLKRMVEIKNTGTDTLLLFRIQPTCGCTHVPPTDTILAAGESTKFEVSIDMLNRRGPQQKSISVTSNDPDRPTFSLTLMADIISDLQSNLPYFPVVNSVMVGKEMSTSLTLVNTSDKTLTVKPPKVKGNKDLKIRFNIKKDVKLKVGDSLVVTAYVTPQKAGPVNEIVTIKNSGKYTPELTLTLNCMAQLVNLNEPPRGAQPSIATPTDSWGAPHR